MSLHGATKACLILIHKWPCIISTSNRTQNQLSNNNNSFDSTLWMQSIPKFKLIEYGFVQEEQHPVSVANIVPILKKNGKIRVCIDFHDLNVACPKYKFSLPITDAMIDNTCSLCHD